MNLFKIFYTKNWVMADKKLPNVLLWVSVFQVLVESNWRREAYKSL